MEDMVDAEAGPHLLDDSHRLPPVLGARRQHAGGHRASGGADDDAEGILLPGQQFGHGLEHPDLIGGARAAAGQHQRRYRRLAGWRLCRHGPIIMVQAVRHRGPFTSGVAMRRVSKPISRVRKLFGAEAMALAALLLAAAFAVSAQQAATPAAAKPAAGDVAPAFSLVDQNGKEHSLADYKGKW